MVLDKEWREVQVHDDGDGKGAGSRAKEEDDDCTTANPFNIFDSSGTTSDETAGYEDVVYKLPSLEIINKTKPSSATAPEPDVIVIKQQSDYPYSTGLAVWGGSELMAKFLLNNRKLMSGKNVLELGSGTGLCSIIAHRLGAGRVLATDGDVDVLRNLRWNAQRNATTKTNWTQGAKDDIVCPQMIWGKDSDSILEEYGPQDVILASDCVYMPPSLEPLWKTVDKLLVQKLTAEADREQPHSAESTGLFIWVNLCASTAPLELVLETANKYGFEWELPKFDRSNGPDEETSELFSEEVFLFRRKG